MIEITPEIGIHENELSFDFIRSSGPGGQNVNKVATAVQLRFDAQNSTSLPEDVRERLIKLAGSRATVEGMLVIDARRHRSREQNRKDAIERLVDLIQKALEKPVVRKKKKPPPGINEHRLDVKRKRSATKQRRKPVSDDE